MATREKKPRSVNSGSPTPSLGGGSDSAPSTPTSKGKSNRASLRQKSKQLQNTNEDSVQSTDDIVDPPATESANTSAGSSSNKSTSTSRTTRATNSEPPETSSSSKEKEKEKDDAKDSKTVTRKTVTKKKKPIAAGASSDKTKTSVTAIKKTTLLKRKTRPIVGKPVLGKKVIARKQVNAKGKKEVTVTLKKDDKKNTSLRNGKPRAIDSSVSKRRAPTPKDKYPKDSTTDSVTIKQERRRSDSVSKSSDVTDVSTTLDTSSAKDDDDKKDDTSLSEIKRELMEENETKSKILDKMAEAFNERKTPTVLPSKDEKAVRRSARQRKSTPKEKEEFVAPPKIKAPVDIKSEPMDTDESESVTPLTIDTEASTKETISSDLEKDSSLSPELISEGVSEISVKEFYSEPAFLENNLGIEKDPKLGEIVQVQEKIKLDKGSESDVAATTAANGSTSVKEEIQQVVVKEEKIEEDENKDDEKMENDKFNSEPMEMEKLKEIIGIVEASKVQSTAPPVVVIPKDEISGNESPLSDRSNDKDTLMSIINKVESNLKKNDSRSDSDGERSGKPSAPKAKATAKEPKTKARNVKDKCKEDEKAKEEKLRQEKLRVEEKVREEKLRAERLKQEEEKKIMEEKMKLEQESKKTAITAATPGKASPKMMDEVVSVLEKVLPTTTVTTLSISSADSHLVLSVTSSESTELVESAKSDPPKLEQIVSNTIRLENLPAITLLKKDPNQVKNESKLENVQVKAELEILPLKEVVVAKEEKTQAKGSESPLQIISRSENAAAVVTLTTVTAEGNKSPLSIIKIQTDKDSDKSTIFEEIPVEAHKGKDSEAVENCDQEIEVLHPNSTKTVVQDSPSVTEAFPDFADSAVDSSLVQSADEESDDVAKQKESHLKHLGLLTLQAASEEKQRRKELVLHKPTTNISSAASNCSSTSSSSSKSGGSSGCGGVGGSTKSTRNSESTGTLKTVIKLNRGEKRKARLPLKMTLQKGKGKGAEKDANGGDGNGETAFYIIQNETDHQQNQSMTDSAGLATAALGRKTHSRSHTTDVVTLPEVVAESAVKEVVQKALVIPEKASSFNVHPERLCQDQCFYCGGKFGLYDTPCHIAAMKSSERQQNILASEVKIKIDSCLCDACFRHVDRKANCPSYRKKTEAKSLSSLAKIQSNVDATNEDKQSQDESSAGTSATSSENLQTSADESKEGSVQRTEELETVEEKIQGSCHVRNCGAGASHTIRRKWLLKMKKTISKILEINLEQTNAVSNLIPLCDGHYELISHLMICAMCKRRLPKNHIYYIVNEIPQLERLIQEQGIAMKLGNSTLVVCKLCRYYANLLLKPPDAKSQKAQFIKNYNRRLLQFYEREHELQEMALASVEPTRIVTNPDIVISDGEDDTIEIVPVGESVSLQRRSHHSRKSTDLSIVDANCAQMAELEEVTITPAPKLTSTANVSGNSSIILDTDVSIEQPASAEKRRKDDSIDMTKALKANPNISMRELFPGEEELGIHINIPFNNTSTRTPEGWVKVNTTLQYDDSTRTLWEELQKPYGNQSSFLRHLVLLEKYFRNGDLILSPQAKNNAATYSEAVQNRLRSFDNVLTPPPVAVIDKSAIRQQLGNAPITITAATKTRTKSSTEPVSLLKSNNPHLIGGTSSGDASLKRKLSTDAKAKSACGKPDAAAGSKVIKLDETIVVPGGKSSNLVPPELISINAKQNVTITSIPPVKPPSTSTQSLPNPQQSLLQPQQSLLQPQSQNKKSPGSAAMREIIKLPDQLTEAERRETSKPWRPTLIPITPGSAETIKAGPLYQTADGRRLPKLVQVMSGGKPYHISIHDYNRMCILRREKLLQQRQDLMQHQFHQHQKRLQQQSPPNPASINATKTTGSKSLLDNAISSAKMVQIPNQILEQNSLIPIPNNSGNNGSNNSNNSSNKLNGPSSELQQLIKTRKPGSNNNMIPPVTSGPAFFKNTLPMNATSNKPISLPNSTSMFSMAGTNQHQQQHQSGSTNTSSPVGSLPTTPSQLDQLIKSNNQFLNNFVSQSQLSAMVAAAAAAAVANSTSNSLIGGGTSGGSILMDNTAAQLLSKIPKSLTVIPQQKQRSLSRVSSNEDQSSA
ncbi:uncharacterized protein east isoform X2 [Ochlerotatus camptorhynchus]|uniref:uncharacterized protein east isoform X2 n=1 Tax=Ochlerotatus camptorhynchus TaxID=644619 RepID=UPI0031D7D727